MARVLALNCQWYEEERKMQEASSKKQERRKVKGKKAGKEPLK